MSALPDSLPVTSRAGQPMLMSMMSAPRSCGHARALAHPACFAADELYDERREVAAFGAAHDVGALADEFGARHHLRDHKPRAQLVRQLAEWQIGYACHRRQQNRVGQAVAADLQVGRVCVRHVICSCIRHILVMPISWAG